MVVAAKRGWKRTCHRHPVDFQMVVLEGRMQFRTHESVKPFVLRRGDDAFIPKYQPHEERVYGGKNLYTLVTISPNIDPANLTEYLHPDECNSTKSPALLIPDIVHDKQGPVNNMLPDTWSATILMHPFSEEQGFGPENEFPFFQLSYGQISYDNLLGEMLVYVKGCLHGEWWFKVLRNGTNYMSRNITSGNWNVTDLGWSFPGKNWTESCNTYLGHSYLNWMDSDADFDWWKKNYRNTSTWSWFDRKNGGFPFRLMFSAPPSSNFKGEKDNLAFFQMYAFSYLVNPVSESVDVSQIHKVRADETGFTCGNPNQYPIFNWTNHFAVSAFMIPVDFPHNPYPTEVFYRWKDDGTENYSGNPFDRSQSTIFYNNYNSFEKISLLRADIFGHWNGSVESNSGESSQSPGQPIKGAGFLTKTSLENWQTTCDTMLADDMPIAQQPPWWPSLGLAQIMGVIKKPAKSVQNDSWVSSFTGSDRTVAIIRVTFPPHLPNYPTSTSLWTWYDYTDFILATAAGNQNNHSSPARPIVFMQSAPKFALGTNLALADFFSFHMLPESVHSRTPLDLKNLRKFCDFDL